jgi:transposase
MNNPPLITKWVIDFQIAGPDALRTKRKGRRKKVDKPKDVIIDTTSNSDSNQEYLKQLEDENLKLRIENAYLKELRRLRLEDEARLREQQESSTASEESSN